jgi:hypothetical protein
VPGENTLAFVSGILGVVRRKVNYSTVLAGRKYLPMECPPPSEPTRNNPQTMRHSETPYKH